jgi:hypothetical protein
MAGRTGRMPGRVLGSRPAQYLGRLAYPGFGWLAVGLGAVAVTDRPTPFYAHQALVGGALAAAIVTKAAFDAWSQKRGGIRPRHSYVIAGGATLALGGLLAVPTTDPGPRTVGTAELVSAVRTAPMPEPNPAATPAELPGGSSCWAVEPLLTPASCTFGDAAARTTVALVGDTRAGNWLPALQLLALAKHWRITTFFAHDCALAPRTLAVAPHPSEAACTSWARHTTDAIGAGHFGLVLLDASSGGDGSAAARLLDHDGTKVIPLTAAGTLPALD